LLAAGNRDRENLLRRPLDAPADEHRTSEKRTHEGVDEHIDALARKYLGQDTYPSRQPGEQRLIIRVQLEHVRVYGG